MPNISNKIPAPEAVSSSSAAPSDAPSPPPSPPWIELPGDVTANILQRLGAEEILESAEKVCTTWWRVCKDPAMWRVVYLRNSKPFETYDVTIMCRRAVDRSRGQLVDLTIEYFGDVEMINYISHGASNLKCLTLRGCYDICGSYLTEAVKKLQELEELHLTNMPSVLAEDVTNIGLTCPKLKSFSYNGCGSKHPRPRFVDYHDDIESQQYDYALAISKSMPNLHHLRLFAQCIDDKRLEAILDGCPHLESLDLRQCYDLDLAGYLAKRCREQIKDLRLPFDSASDIQHLVGGPLDWDDLYSYDDSIDGFSDCDYYCDYDDYEQYDDYLSPPLGYGFFDHGNVPPGFFDVEEFGAGFFDHDYL